jgi:zinc transport system ATP-binding protein
MTNHPIIQLNDISAAYDGKTVLSRVNLNVYEHDFLGVIGPNGGGKTTLIKLILGLLKPVSGTIRFYKNGKEVPEITMGYLPHR